MDLKLQHIVRMECTPAQLKHVLTHLRMIKIKYTASTFADTDTFPKEFFCCECAAKVVTYEDSFPICAQCAGKVED